MPHPSCTLLDRALPSWHLVERHARTVAADLATTWRALGETPVRSVTGRRPRSVAELQRPLGDDWGRVGMDFRLVGLGAAPARTELPTETRVPATGPRAERAFRACCALIGGWSGLVRRELLRAVARRAEAGGA